MNRYDIVNKIIGIPFIIPMAIMIYLTLISDPIMKIPLKSFISMIGATFIIAVVLFMSLFGLYYMFLKRYD